jgi:hypothetical protein
LCTEKYFWEFGFVPESGSAELIGERRIVCAPKKVDEKVFFLVDSSFLNLRRKDFSYYKSDRLISGGRQTVRKVHVSDWVCTPRRENQGCQIVFIHTKNPNLGIFWRAMEWRMLVYFKDIICTYYPHFSILFPHFGILYQEKSGNPGRK